MDPRDLGCDCTHCALGPTPGTPWRPVVPALRDPVGTLIVMDSPLKSDVEARTPGTGRTGEMLGRLLRQAGTNVDSVSMTLAMLCRPPTEGKDDLKIYLLKLSRDNKRRAKAGLMLRGDPLVCCKPRLLRECASADYIVPLGNYAAKSVLGADTKPSEIAGAPVEWRSPDGATRVPALASLAPSFVGRFGRWRPVLGAHLARAVRAANGAIEWIEPDLMMRPTVEQFDNWCADRARRRTVVAHDSETTFDGPRYAKVRCWGFGDTKSAIVVPFMSPDPDLARQGESLFRKPEEARRMRAAFKHWMESRELPKVGWNSGNFDRTVSEREMSCIATPETDLILVHRLAYPEHPHDLSFAARLEIATPAWKGDKTSSDDVTLWIYNGRDCVNNARLVKPLVTKMTERGVAHLLPLDKRMQENCRQIMLNGMNVIPSERERLTTHWRRELNAQRAGLLDCGRRLEFRGGAEWNPASGPQVAELLFDHLGLDPVKETELGDPSTDDGAIRDLMRHAEEPAVKELLDRMRRFRRAMKMLGTFLVNLPVDEKTGRVHASWNSHVTMPRRRSCSGPNLQTYPPFMRGVFGPPAGRTWVAADFSQLHLRIIAAVSGDDMLVEHFKNGGDPHTSHARYFYGDLFEAANKSGRKKMRKVAKEATYALMYLAKCETAWESVTSAEDENFNLVYPDMTLRAFRPIYEKFWQLHPKIRRWGEKQTEAWRNQGFLRDPICGMRNDFGDGENPNEMVNFPVLAGEQGIAIPAYLELVDLIPFGYAGQGTGQVHDGHDSVTFETPDDLDEVNRVARIIKTNMTRMLPWTDVPFNCDVAIHPRLDRTVELEMKPGEEWDGFTKLECKCGAGLRLQVVPRRPDGELALEGWLWGAQGTKCPACQRK